MVEDRRWILASAVLFVLTACSAPAASPSTGPTTAADRPSPTVTPRSTAVPSPTHASPPGVTSVASHTMTCSYNSGTCEIMGLDADGAVIDGWPVTLAGECRDPVTASDGRTLVACDGEREAVVHALVADGTAAPGWPVDLPARSAQVSANTFGISCGEPVPAMVVSTDGTLFVGSAGPGDAVLHAIEPDGTVRPGWPRPFPGDPPIEQGGDGCRGFTLAPDGSIVAWGYEDEVPDIYLIARRTEFTVLKPDGTTRPGWPRGSVGAASGPVVGDDGSLSYVTAAGNVWRHGRDGEPVAGWPFELGETLRPYPVADGRLAFLREGPEPEATVIDAAGTLVVGWPVVFDRPLQSRCLFGDTPCVGTVTPIFAPDGTLFAALGTANWTVTAGDGAIAMVGPDGRMVPGWPVLLGDLGHAVGLSIDPHGRLEVDVVSCAPDAGECTTEWMHATRVYETDGMLVPG